MRKIKEVLRLHFEAQLSERQIANICALGKGTVRRFLERAEMAVGHCRRSWMTPRWRRNCFHHRRHRRQDRGPNRITPPFTGSCGSPM
jgi:hypothetical protein